MALSAIKNTASSEIDRLAKIAISAIGGRVEKEARDLFAKAEILLTGALKRRALDEYDRFSRIKTLFSDGKLIDIDAIYVEQNLKWGKDVVTEKQFHTRLQSSRHAVISGIAGTGKSLLLRQLFRKLVVDKPTFYPVFIELRHLKQASYPTILTHVANILSSRKYKLTEEHIHLALDEGAIALLLDGFDEVDYDARERYQTEILDISSRYGKAIIALTSRNDPDRFRAWTDFNEVTVLPLTPEQTVQLISKIEEDKDLKKNFIEQARKKLFATHSTLLSNPLLAGMMLITFKRIADIPTKQHIFYREAFYALYDRHDASKGGPYSRKRYAVLDIDSFSEAFSIFCFLTYADRRLSMSEKEAVQYIEEGFSYIESPSSPKDFLKDLLESVCLMISDGDELTFTHRSFQEYFCAQFLASNRVGNQYEIINTLLKDAFDDNVMPMLMGINQEMLEKDWTIPLLERTIALLENVPKPREDNTQGSLAKICKELFEHIVLQDGQIHALSGMTQFGAAIVTLERLYRSCFYREISASDPLRQKPKSRASKSKRAKTSVTLPVSAEHENLLRESWFLEWMTRLKKGSEALSLVLKEKYLKRESSIRDLLRGAADNRERRLREID